MLRHVLALWRGETADAEERFLDRNALALLRQGIHDGAVAVAAARKAVAVAQAQHEREAKLGRRLDAQIADLETRTVAAMEADKTDLAREAAAAIAHLEAERTASADAERRYGTEIERLRASVRQAETRLCELERGARVVTAVERTQRLRGTVEGGAAGARLTLADAEAALARLRARQAVADRVEAAANDFDASHDPARLAEKLAAAGCGAPVKPDADAVLARLASRVRRPA